MKAGKTYVYKSEADRQEFIDGVPHNKLIDRAQKGEFHVARITHLGHAISSMGHCINDSEFKYFKLKENKMLKPDGMINVEMTVLDGMKLRAMIGRCKVTSASLLFKELGKTLGVSRAVAPSLDYVAYFNWGDNSELTKAALAQFKDPNQDKIDELEATIIKATEELAKITKEGEL